MTAGTGRKIAAPAVNAAYCSAIFLPVIISLLPAGIFILPGNPPADFSKPPLAKRKILPLRR